MSKSMFVGPENVKTFGPEDPYWVPEPSRWNRELYYSTETHMVDVRSLERAIDLDDLFTLKTQWEGVSGVWSLWGRKNATEPLICLDVHETLDLGYEMRMHEKSLDEARNTPWDADIYTKDNLFSLEKRSKAISQWQDLEYRAVALDVRGKVKREAIEAQYAWNHKAVYWNRNYFQAVTKEMFENQLKNDYIKNLR